MPYITKQQRWDVNVDYAHRMPNDSGELNYILTTVCLDYLAHKGERYVTMNDVVGALESCKLEMYRRLVSPYEDSKVKENGDVYTSN
jgi:hypothetical protein